MGVFAGNENLHQLKKSLMSAEIEIYGGASPRVLPFIDMKSISGLMQDAGFLVPVIDNEQINIEYGSLQKLFNDIRFMGESNCMINRSKKFTKKSLFDACEIFYKDCYGDENGRMNACFDLIFLSGWSDD